MAEPGALDYFYGTEAEQYTFYRIPKVLFTDPGFRRITADAKILYGLMLDRMGLSIRNGWLDEQERVFIYFTLEEAMDAMCCGHNKAVSLFTELDKVGLIERKKQGQGRPTKIYVKNFTRKEEVKTSENRKSALPETGTLDFRKSDTINTDKNKTDRNDTDPSTGKSLPTHWIRKTVPVSALRAGLVPVLPVENTGQGRAGPKSPRLWNR